MPLSEATQEQIKQLADTMLVHSGTENEGTWGRVVFLLGAGFSVSAGIPLGSTIAQDCTLELAQKVARKDFPDADSALGWLIENKEWPDHREKVSGWSQLYGWIFATAYSTAADQRRVINQAINKGGGKINWAHLCLGELVKQRLVHTVLTVNFDQLALEAIIKTGIMPVVADGLESLNRLDNNPKTPQVVHLHGSRHAYRPRNSTKDVEGTTESMTLQGTLYPLLRDSILVVCGYAGAEEGVMKLLGQAARELPDLHVYWAAYDQSVNNLAPSVQQLLKEGTQKVAMLGCDADELMLKLMELLKIGTPGWMQDPIGHLITQADFFVEHKNSDIRTLIDSYKEDLLVLEAALKNRRKSQDLDEVLREVSELRLKGEYTQAFTKLEPFFDSNHQNASFLEVFADCAYETGCVHPERNILEQCASANKLLLKLVDREDDPLEWGEVQNNLGNALLEIGTRQGSQAKLEEAVTTFRLSLEERRREQVPLDWAATQNNLGNALKELGGLKGDSSKLEEAVAAYRLSLEETARERVPLRWAATQNNLGNALKELGGLERDSSRLEEAIAAYRLALEERTRERAPLYWATTQNNLANALKELGGLQGDRSKLEEAVEAYRLALEERTRERGPLDWAMTQYNLGIALDEFEDEPITLGEAAAAFRLALEERTYERVPLDWATTTHRLGLTLLSLWKHLGEVAVLTEAKACFIACLEGYANLGHSRYVANAKEGLERAEGLLLEDPAQQPSKKKQQKRLSKPSE